MATLITGGTGMVGSYIARILIDRGETPLLFDLSLDEEQIKDIKSKVKIIKGNVLDLIGMVRLIKNEQIDNIIHTAGLLAVAIGEDPLSGIKVNIEGTANVLEAARIMDIKRVVFASTCMVYDFTKKITDPVNEDAPKLPGGIYASTKLACEYIGLNYSEIYGVDFIAVRFARIFGPGYWSAGATPNPGTRMIKDMIEKSVMGEPVVVQRPKMSKDEWLYVKDAAQAAILARDAKDLKHRIFNIGSGHLYEFQEIVEVVKLFLPNAKITILEPNPTLSNQWVYRFAMPVPIDISRAREELGYRPQYLLKDAIQDYINRITARFDKRP